MSDRQYQDRYVSYRPIGKKSIYGDFYNKAIDILYCGIVDDDRLYDELIPIMYVLLVRDKIDSMGFFDWLQSLPDAEQKAKFMQKRLESLYGNILDGKINPRYDWLLGQKPTKTGQLMDCIGAFGDILINPECSENYEKAPMVIHDIFELSKFADKMKDFGEHTSNFLDIMSDAKSKIYSNQYNYRSKKTNPWVSIAIFVGLIILALIIANS